MFVARARMAMAMPSEILPAEQRTAATSPWREPTSRECLRTVVGAQSVAVWRIADVARRRRGMRKLFNMRSA